MENGFQKISLFFFVFFVSKAADPPWAQLKHIPRLSINPIVLNVLARAITSSGD